MAVGLGVSDVEALIAVCVMWLEVLTWPLGHSFCSEITGIHLFPGETKY